MRRSLLVAATAFTALTAWADAAMAVPGYVTSRVYMRAGPGTEFPVVERINRGHRVDIQGCVYGWGWCEITTGYEYGWVHSDYVQTIYQRRYVPIARATQVQVPIVSFNIGYWDTHYRSRPFYIQRSRFDRWEDRREHREDWRERREDARERREDAHERWEDRQERREDARERREDWRERQEDRHGHSRH